MSHIRKNQWTTGDLPSSEELRDSGQIAQLADFVLMMVRKRSDNRRKDLDEIYAGNQSLLGVMENRHNGRTKKIALEFTNNEFKQIAYENFHEAALASAEAAWD
jgi:replicative DNA helicase